MTKAVSIQDAWHAWCYLDRCIVHVAHWSRKSVQSVHPNHIVEQMPSLPPPTCFRVDQSLWDLSRDSLSSTRLTLPETSSLLLAIKRFKGELTISSPRSVVKRRADKVTDKEVDFGNDDMSHYPNARTCHNASSAGYDHLSQNHVTVMLQALESMKSKATSRALIEAAKTGSVEEMRTLLDLGADVNAEDEDGWSALHWSVCEGSVDKVGK